MTKKSLFMKVLKDQTYFYFNKLMSQPDSLQIVGLHIKHTVCAIAIEVFQLQIPVERLCAITHAM